jgi:predicted MFS family arabinose efflux permease
VAAGAILLTGGLFLTAYASSALLLILGMGVLFGMGISCTSFGVVLTAVGKLARPEDRSAAMGLASAGGSVGQVLLIPFAQGISAHWGVTAALVGLGLLTLVVAPLGYFLTTRGRLDVAPDPGPHLPVRSAVAQAVGNDGYCLLTIGFFTCGFQLAFIATHLPTYLGLCGMPANSGAMALALIGLFNMVGSWGCGWLGGRFRQRNVLALVYLLRSTAIIAFFLAPKTDITVGLFAAIMGLLWLGTVPLTTGVIAKIFGVRHLGTLFGMCFLSHQIGSFIGSWAGGIVLQQTGSYTPIWLATAAAGIVAAALHGSIRDKPAAMALRA